LSTPTLHQSLRALKLSGMLETLAARLAQARGGELGHLDFLQVLCDDEITRREAHAIARRARFDQQATLEEFDFAASPKLPAAQIRDLAALCWLQVGESVILFGPVGVGKAMSHKHWGIWRSAGVPRSGSPRPAKRWLIWQVGTPITPVLADLGRFRHAGVDRAAGRRSLRADL
jgi:IstB-like ATP binding protein